MSSSLPSGGSELVFQGAGTIIWKCPTCGGDQAIPPDPTQWVSLGYVDPATVDFSYEQPKKKVEQQQGAYRTWRLFKLTGLDQLAPLIRDKCVYRPGENVMAPDSLFGYKGSVTGFHGFFDYTSISAQEVEAYLVARRGISAYQFVLEASNTVFPNYNYYGQKYYENLYYVIGSTLNYGKVKIHKKGLRSEKSRPETLVLSESTDFNLRLMGVAEQYGMKLVTEAEAKEYETGLIPVKEDEL